MEQSVKDILQTIDDAINAFQDKIPGLQKKMFDELQPLIKELQLKNGKLLNNVNNLKFLGQIKNKLERIIISPEYKDAVQQFISSYNTLAALNVSYFKQFNEKYKPAKTLPIIKQLAIEKTITDLIGQGMSETITGAVRNIINTNLTTGGSYADLQDQLREHLLNTDSGEGSLVQYTKQITTDSINQYHAQYHAAIAQDLKFNWGRYVGSLITTSRQFCVLLTAKQWVHKSELPTIILGHIDGEDCKLSKTTGLPYGMIPGTNAANFEINRGGYNCGHQFFWVPDSVVPDSVKNKLNKTEVQKEADTKVLMKGLYGEAYDYVTDEMLKKFPEMNKGDLASILAYGGSDYSDLNAYLRGTSDYNPDYQKNMEIALNNALDKVKPYEGIVYRGAKLKDIQIEKYKQAFAANEEITDPAFISTSFDPEMSFSGTTKFQIKSKSGKMVNELLDMEDAAPEREILFKNNTRFKITGFKEDEGFTYIEMEEV